MNTVVSMLVQRGIFQSYFDFLIPTEAPDTQTAEDAHVLLDMVLEFAGDCKGIGPDLSLSDLTPLVHRWIVWDAQQSTGKRMLGVESFLQTGTVLFEDAIPNSDMLGSPAVGFSVRACYRSMRLDTLTVAHAMDAAGHAAGRSDWFWTRTAATYRFKLYSMLDWANKLPPVQL